MHAPPVDLHYKCRAWDMVQKAKGAEEKREMSVLEGNRHRIFC